MKVHRREKGRCTPWTSDIKGKKIKASPPPLLSAWRLALAIDTRVLDSRLLFEEPCPRSLSGHRSRSPTWSNRKNPRLSGKLFPFGTNDTPSVRFRERRRPRKSKGPRIFSLRDISKEEQGSRRSASPVLHSYIIHENTWPRHRMHERRRGR